MNLDLPNRVQSLHHTLMALERPQTPPFPKSSVPQSQPRLQQRVPAIAQFYFKHWSSILLVLELLLNLYFLHHGPLHPIDYPTYLVQARQFRLGERDYAEIYGPTGPLVYPGGHVIIFSVFERLFGIKGDVDWSGYLAAQWIFLILQLIHTWVSPFEIWTDPYGRLCIKYIELRRRCHNLTAFSFSLLFEREIYS